MNKREESEYKILALIGADRSVYVFFSTTRDTARIYRRHSSHSNSVTSSMFDLSEPPSLYLLDQVKTVKPRAFGLCVVWSMYFWSRGYKIVDLKMHPHMVHMHTNDKEEYIKIRDKRLEHVLNAETKILTNYVSREPKTHKVVLDVTKQDYDALKFAAAGVGLTVQAYARKRFDSSPIMRLDVNGLNECRRKITEVANMASNIAVQGQINGVEENSILTLKNAITDLRLAVNDLTTTIMARMKEDKNDC